LRSAAFRHGERQFPAARRFFFATAAALWRRCRHPFRTPMPNASFVKLAGLPVKEIFNGTIRGHYAHLDRTTFGEVHLQAGTVVPIHQHPHEQVTYVLEGRFEFTIGDETTILEPGMAALIPGGTPHGGTTLTACRVIDMFAPVREEYRT
jgi:quercetin dioxygenase-like cupin family protein